MRIKVLSDLHGAAEALRRATRDADVVFVLGDLINVLDYRTMEGILVDVFGREPVEEAVRHRAGGRYEEARRAIRRTVGDDEDAYARYVQLATRQYEQVFEAMPEPAYITYGNADIPHLLSTFARGEIRLLDGDVVELDGERWGVVGGGIRTAMAAAGEVDEPVFDAKLESLGEVDVVCTHVPPRIPWYVYDVLGRRFEPGSRGLVAYVRRYRPRRAYFGHVHNPLVARGMLGSTELVNVGYFRGTSTAWIHDREEHTHGRRDERLDRDRGAHG